MEKIENNKWEKLKQYLAQLEHTQCLLLDMLRSNELSKEEYDKMIGDSQKAYYRFIKDLKTKPVDESQLEIDFPEETTIPKKYYEDYNQKK